MNASVIIAICRKHIGKKVDVYTNRKNYLDVILKHVDSNGNLIIKLSNNREVFVQRAWINSIEYSGGDEHDK